MVEKRDCTFCGSAIEPGTGMLFIKRDGTRFQFCSSKCRRNMLDLKRVPRTVKWSKHYIKGLGKASATQTKKMKAAPKPVAAAATTSGTASESAPEAPAKPAKAKPPKAKPNE
jgi:large subunit ribosomal protein L24e